MIIRWIAPAAAGLLVATGALAEPEPPPPPSPPQGAGGLFISPSGEPFRGPDGLGTWFARADRDGDSLLTLAEFRLDAEALFRALDANDDGVIDGFENQTYEREIVPEITRSRPAGPQGGERGGRPPPGGSGDGGPLKSGKPPRGTMGPGGADGALQGAAPYGLLNIPQPVRNADADLNGRVSWAEWGQAAKRRFERLDADGDGVLTLAALRDLAKSRGGARPEGAPRRAGP